MICNFFHYKDNFFENTFFPSLIPEWNNLDSSIRKYRSLGVYEQKILQLVLPYSAIQLHQYSRGGSRTATTSKMEGFVVIVNGQKPLTIFTKRSILDFAAVLHPPLVYKRISQDCTMAQVSSVNIKLSIVFWIHLIQYVVAIYVFNQLVINYFVAVTF